MESPLKSFSSCCAYVRALFGVTGSKRLLFGVGELLDGSQQASFRCAGLSVLMVMRWNIVIDVGKVHQAFVGKSSVSPKRKLDVLPPIAPFRPECLLSLLDLLVVVGQGVRDESASFRGSWIDVGDARCTCIKVQIFTR